MTPKTYTNKHGVEITIRESWCLCYEEGQRVEWKKYSVWSDGFFLNDFTDREAAEKYAESIEF